MAAGAPAAFLSPDLNSAGKQSSVLKPGIFTTLAVSNLAHFVHKAADRTATGSSLSCLRPSPSGPRGGDADGGGVQDNVTVWLSGLRPTRATGCGTPVSGQACPESARPTSAPGGLRLVPEQA